MRALLRLLTALATGVVFGFGLALSGMMNPARVLGFLDVAGHWNPSLAFVLAGAVGLSALGYVVSERMAHPALADEFQVPKTQGIDQNLIGGSALFGVGWGLVGLCPGPALAGLSLHVPSIYVFVAAMLIGMVLHRILLVLPKKQVASVPTR